ncbi:hypothetical protein AGLY_013454 [Aphis glycines]|uniref:Uncharacterized protein n=1 Tax=Aphis glycines TaxID=307491 RepID=A0A6G0T6Z5_APHGL|nr:hypothetical protein AGLY_013454 [Aphis glycines]
MIGSVQWWFLHMGRVDSYHSKMSGILLLPISIAQLYLTQKYQNPCCHTENTKEVTRHDVAVTSLYTTLVVLPLAARMTKYVHIFAFIKNQTRLGAISIELDSFKMNFWNSFQKVATWSAASYLYVRWFLEIVSIFLLDNKYVIMCFTVSFMTSWTIILYFTTDVWLLYVARLIAGSVMMVYYCMFMRKLLNTKKKQCDIIICKIVIFIFASSRLVERASRREHLSTSREVDVADAARTIDERLGMLEDAVRSLSAEFALFTLNNVLKNQAPTANMNLEPKEPLKVFSHDMKIVKINIEYISLPIRPAI